MSKSPLFLFLGVVGSLLASGQAAAAGKAFSDPTVQLERGRIAETLGPDASTRWLSLKVTGTGRLVWILPVVPGTRADALGGDFLWGLESSTAPRVRAPKAAPMCDGKPASVENTAELSDAEALGPSEIAVLDNASAVGAFVTDRGIAFQPAAETELAGYGPFLAVVYDVTGATWTDALRLASPEAAPGIELTWLGNGVDVTLYTLAEGRAHAANVELLDTSELDITFQLADEKSDYVEQRRSQLLVGQGVRFLPEASGTTPLFGWSVLPNQSGAVEPAVKTYLERAAPAGVDACFGAVLDAAASLDPVGIACAPGALAVVPGAPPCQENVMPGVISAAELRCLTADDLALAFAGLHVGSVRVTRQSTVTGPSSPSPLVLSVDVPFDQSLLVTADDFDQKGCVLGGSGGAPGSGGSGWSGDGGYGNSPYPDPYYTDEPAEPVHVEVDCWGNTQTGSSDDSCSGDSSSDSEGDTCSGDSSDSSGDGDTCGGDSSSSEGDTCGGDSSSGEGDTCSGDSGSSGGDSCSGDSGGDSCSSGSSGGSGDCSVAKVRRPRVKVSALTLFLMALALPLRRVTRKKRR